MGEHHEPLPLRPIAHALRCIADALDYVHRVRGPHRKPLGLIHRDVSPSNILLGAEGRIKLSDFGVAGMARDAARPGTVIGKPRYLARQRRATGKAATQAWDLYALGVVLHGALSGDGDGEQAMATIGPRLRPLAEVRPDCGALVTLVERATDRTAATRLQTAAEFRGLLDEAVPKQADDVEMWRELVAEVYRRDAFVARYGVLPHIEDLVPELHPAPAPANPVAYVETEVGDAHRPQRFGMSPALGIEAARAQGERVATWLKHRLERDVRPVVVGDYRSLVDAIAEGELDFAWMPPLAFVLAAERGVGVVALAQRYGRPTYESAIVVHEDSALQTLPDLQGRSIAFVDRDSAGGYLYAIDLIGRHVGRPSSVLGEQIFQGSHKAACNAVARRWVDAGTTYVVRDGTNKIVNSGWLDLFGADPPRLRVLASTDPIPCDSIAHRPGLASGLVDRLARTVVDVDADDTEGLAVLTEIFHTSGMMRADLRIYDAVRETLKRTAKLTA